MYYTACNDEFRQNLRSHSWDVFLFSEYVYVYVSVRYIYIYLRFRPTFFCVSNVRAPQPSHVCACQLTGPNLVSFVPDT